MTQPDPRCHPQLHHREHRSRSDLARPRVLVRHDPLLDRFPRVVCLASARQRHDRRPDGARKWFGPSNDIEFNGVSVPTENVVQFLSPVNGLLWQGARAIDIAYRLDEAAKRFASNEITAGYLQQKDGEPMSGEELSDLSAAWAEAPPT